MLKESQYPLLSKYALKRLGILPKGYPNQHRVMRLSLKKHKSVNMLSRYPMSKVSEADAEGEREMEDYNGYAETAIKSMETLIKRLVRLHAKAKRRYNLHAKTAKAEIQDEKEPRLSTCRKRKPTRLDNVGQWSGGRAAGRRGSSGMAGLRQ